MWADNPNRKKFYTTNQGCDVVTVFDAATSLQMRYIKIGASPQIESPHMIKISPDGQYWYASFSNSGTVLEKHRTSDDSYVGQINLGIGLWNTFTITSDSKKAFVVDWESDGKILYVDLENLKVITTYSGAGLFAYPHGSAVNSTGTTLYVTAQYGNFIYKIDVTDPLNPNINLVTLDDSGVASTAHSLDPHDIAFAPDDTLGLYYFVTCEYSNEVRVMQVSNDQLVATVNTGHYPQEMSFSKTKQYLFVSCMYDSTTTETRGSVSAISYALNQSVGPPVNLIPLANIKNKIAEPHGIGVDDNKGLVYVANRNLDGPLPHHTTSCAGKIGFVSFIDMNTLTTHSKTEEVAVDPYSIAVRK